MVLSNLLLNINPRSDGSVPSDQIAHLREAGVIIRKDGFPLPVILDRKVRSSWKSHMK